MPFYYRSNRAATTNGTGNTCTSHVRLVTVANQQNCFVVGLYAAVRNSTTAGGTSLTPAPSNPLNRAADTTAFTDATAFNSAVGTAYSLDIGFAQTGGQGGWVALERDHALILNPNAGANGNITLDSFTATASQLLEVTAEHGEG